MAQLALYDGCKRNLKPGYVAHRDNASTPGAAGENYREVTLLLYLERRTPRRERRRAPRIRGRGTLGLSRETPPSASTTSSLARRASCCSTSRIRAARRPARGALAPRGSVNPGVSRAPPPYDLDHDSPPTAAAAATRSKLECDSGPARQVGSSSRANRTGARGLRRHRLVGPQRALVGNVKSIDSMDWLGRTTRPSWI